MTQQELAARLNGRSAGWMSQVERGIQPVRRVDVLQEIADALGVSIQMLDPSSPIFTPSVPPVTEATNDLDGARTVISGHPAIGLITGVEESGAIDLGALEESVEQIWEYTHRNAYPEISETIAALLPQLERAVRTVPAPDRPVAYRNLARAYQALAAAFARQGDSRSSWVSADRAVAAGERSGDIFLVHAGIFRMVHAFVRLGHNQEAEHAVTEAVAALQRRADLPPEGLSVLGSLHLAKALVHARSGQRSEARAELESARRVAEQIGEDRNDYNLEFGPTNVMIQTVSTALDLGDAGEALDIGQSIDAASLSPERQARLLMDLGRAHAQRRHTPDAVECLLRAEEMSPDLVRQHSAARAAIRELLLVSGPKASADLVALAARASAAE
ncbi:hypothetical protein STTU_p0111 (plasmid) [Streptomyces sp. Tu6071]|nr:hypothetical protein STTU_p0111 [Streptomyces sp. Tu6071]